MYKKIKRKALEANLKLQEYGLVLFTWGNASQIDQEREFVAIKPSGVRYEDMTLDHICVLKLADGAVVDGALNPSTDVQTHLEIYRHFSGVGGVVHTHSTYATAFAQAGLGIPCYGTTHADYFYGEVPCTRAMLPDEVESGYEFNTGRLIVKEFQAGPRDPLAMPGALVKGHGPFTWGEDAEKAAENAAYLEEIARLAYITGQISKGQPETGQFGNITQNIGRSAPRLQTSNGPAPIPQYLLDKHFLRKHGKNAYYGQVKNQD